MRAPFWIGLRPTAPTTNCYKYVLFLLTSCEIRLDLVLRPSATLDGTALILSPRVLSLEPGFPHRLSAPVINRASGILMPASRAGPYLKAISGRHS
jgi:hypothetical protein